MFVATTLILIQSVILRMIMDKDETPNAWIEKINQTFTANRLGGMLAKTPSLPEDIPGLMENLYKSPESSYLAFCRIIDFLSFLALLICFITMFIALFPKGYLSVDYNPLEMLS